MRLCALRGAFVPRRDCAGYATRSNARPGVTSFASCNNDTPLVFCARRDNKTAAPATKNNPPIEAPTTTGIEAPCDASRSAAVGAVEGDVVGSAGADVGEMIGELVGDRIGAFVGEDVGEVVGVGKGAAVGCVEGEDVGFAVGEDVSSTQHFISASPGQYPVKSVPDVHNDVCQHVPSNGASSPGLHASSWIQQRTFGGSVGHAPG